MSIKLMGQVWEHVFTHSEQSVMLALADHADDHGTHIYPSIALVAWKTGYSKRQVKRLLNQLRAKGVLIVVANARRGRPTEYRINIEAAPKKPPFSRTSGDITTPQSPRDAVTSTTVEVTSATGSGDISGCIEPSRTIKEPPTEKCERVLQSRGASVNATEMAHAVCLQNGWSGRDMIWALASAIEHQAKRMPDAGLQQVAGWLVARWRQHVEQRGHYAGSVHRFFAEGKYTDARTKTKTIAVNPAEVIRLQEQGVYE